MTVELAILIGGALLLAGVASSRLSDVFGVPALLLFLGIGMLAGSDGPGGIAFDAPEQAQAIGTVALLVILFAGGLDTRWSDARPVLLPGLVLATVGVGLTFLLVGAFAWWMLGTWGTFDIGPFGLSWVDALLLGAIISSTDAAAVFSVYRTSPVQPRPRLRALLELESGSNDPMAVVLTTTLLDLHVSGHGVTAGLVGVIVAKLLAGGAIGFGVGYVGVTAVNGIRLSARGLYPILVLSLGLVAFGLSELFGGNGFLAVYVAGVAIAHRLERERDAVENAHEGMDWLMQIGLLEMLGLLVFPSKLMPVAGVAIALAFFLMLVARPLAVVVCLAPFRPSLREIAYVSWVGLRGSVPIVLATFPATWGVERADQIFHVVFFVVLISVGFQGLTLVPAARFLGVTDEGGAAGEAS